MLRADGIWGFPRDPDLSHIAGHSGEGHDDADNVVDAAHDDTDYDAVSDGEYADEADRMSGAGDGDALTSLLDIVYVFPGRKAAGLCVVCCPTAEETKH